MIFVISDRSICLKLTIRFLRLNFCQAWKLLKSLKNHCTDSWRKQWSQNYFFTKENQADSRHSNIKIQRKKTSKSTAKPLQTFDFWISVLVIANVLRNISKYWKSELFVWFGQDFKTGFDALNADTFTTFYRYDQIWLLRTHKRTVMDLLKQL